MSEHDLEQLLGGFATNTLTVEERSRLYKTAMQDQQRSAQSEIADVRKNAQASRGRLSSLEALQHAALGQEQGAGVGARWR